jgi:hypothetical protein
VRAPVWMGCVGCLSAVQCGARRRRAGVGAQNSVEPNVESEGSDPEESLLRPVESRFQPVQRVRALAEVRERSEPLPAYCERSEPVVSERSEPTERKCSARAKRAKNCRSQNALVGSVRVDTVHLAEGR